MTKQANHTSSSPQNSPQESTPMADRGWYLALEYSTVSGQDKFQARLSKLRNLGNFKELLEPDGKITYRNLFRHEDMVDAWSALTLLKPWRAKVNIYMNGGTYRWKTVSDLVWCAGFLAAEEPCRGNFEAKRFEVGCRQVVSFAPFHWDRIEEKRRHVLSFADMTGADVRFDIDAVLEFLGDNVASQNCPLAPVKNVAGWQKALAPVPLKSFNWFGNLTLSDEIQKSLGTKSIERLHSYFKASSSPSLVGEVTMLLHQQGEEATLHRYENGVQELVSRDLELSGALQNAVQNGAVFQVIRKGERYSRRKGRQNEIEETFQIKPAFLLEDASEFDTFRAAYDIQAIPSGTLEYREWVKFAMNCMRLKPAKR